VDLERLYAYRFRSIDQASRQAVWTEIAAWVYSAMGRPNRVLDPAAGRCEFINAVPAQERWIVDTVDHAEFRDADVKALIADIFTVDLPAQYFDGVFVSNFLEHLDSPEMVSRFLRKIRESMAPGGRVFIMGPNFRYAARRYFDYADHVLPLTHVSVSEHVYTAGFEIERVVPRFLPYSFRTRLPVLPRLVHAYLRVPMLWRALGQQFAVVGRADEGGLSPSSRALMVETESPRT